MKGKLSSIWRVAIAVVLVLSFSLVTAVPVAAQEEMPDAVVFPFELGGKTAGNYTAEWSTAPVHGGSSSVHLKTTGTVGTGDEARILIDFSDLPDGEEMTLGDLVSISWYEYLEAGYPPHLDISLDFDGDGVRDDILVFEYAYNTEAHAAEGGPTYGALNDAWYPTFDDDDAGPAQIDDTANCWLGSGPPGPLEGEDFIYGTLAEWKAGTVDPSVDADTVVVALEIEVDNWIVQTEAYVDDIAINGMLVCGLIQDAVDTIGADSLIYVMPGSYDAFDANKAGITVLADSAEITASPITVDGQANAIVVSAHDVTISGFTINAAQFSTGIKIYNATTPPHGAVIWNNVIDFTGFDPNTMTGCTYGGGCIQAKAGSGAQTIIEDNDVAFGPADTWGHEGIASWGMDDADIIIRGNNVAISSTGAVNKYHNGIVLHGTGSTDSSGSALIDNNTVTVVALGEGMWKHYGIYILGLVEEEYLNNVTITNNTVTGPGYCDWAGKSTGYALRMSGPRTNHIHVMNNNFKDYEFGMVLENDASCDDVHVNFNNIVGNDTGIQTGVTYTIPVPTLNAGMNWWGDISGPTVEGEGPHYSGAGDSVSGNVNFQPWLTRTFETLKADEIAYQGMPMVGLNTGWNTFSTPIALDGGCDEWDEYVALGDGLNIHATSPAYAFDGAAQDWLPLIGEDADYLIKPCDAIYVRMAEPDVAAVLQSPEVSVPSKDLSVGWNLVSLGWMPDGPVDGMSVPDALETVYTVTGDLTGYSLVVSPQVNDQQWFFTRDGEDEEGPPVADWLKDYLVEELTAWSQSGSGMPFGDWLADKYTGPDWTVFLDELGNWLMDDCWEWGIVNGIDTGSEDFEWMCEDLVDEVVGEVYEYLIDNWDEDEWSLHDYLNRFITQDWMRVTKGYWVFMINPGTLAGFTMTPIPWMP